MIAIKVKKFILWGIPFIFGLGSLIHFLYQLSGESVIVALFSPVNESVWEHLKLPVFPTIIWWILTYLILKKYNIDFRKWIFSCIISIIVCISFIIIFHYTYTGALGIKSTFLDILSFLIGIIMGQYTAYIIYINIKIQPVHYLLVFSFFVIIVIMFILFTFYTPQLPIFLDNNTGTYGILKK